MAVTTDAITIAELRSKRDEILRIAESLGAANVRVFGSVARNEADSQSDIDLLVDIVAEVRGWNYFGLLVDLQSAFTDLLGRDVHVVDSASLKRIKIQVLRDAIPI